MSEDETASNAAMFQRMGDYEILGVLGAGGMGKVYKVRNVLTERIEAMKILLPDLAGQKELADRFLREIKLLAGLSHPNIASLRTALTVGNQLVMIMELVEGVTLAARLEHGALSPGDAVDYIDQVLKALSYAHGEHIIHRDVKPANMMLTPQGVVKLMDFGIARPAQDRSLTMTGTTLGSLYYMSPEQIRGEAVDARSDLYSVGVSLYELVVGRRPFQATANYSVMAAHLQQAPTPPTESQPGLPAALNDVILMAMAKDPAQRFQSADAFRNALKTITDSLGSHPQGLVSAPPLPAGPVGATSAFQGSLTGTGPAGLAATPSQAPFQPAVRPVLGTVPGNQPQPEPLPGASPLPRPSPAIQPVPAPAMRGAYRGLYMTLGALVVVAVLVAAGLYGPRWAKTRASGGSVRDSQPASHPPSSVVPPSSSANNGEATTNAPSSSATSSDSGTSPSSSSQPPSTPPPTDDTGAGSNLGESSQIHPIHGAKAAPTGVPRGPATQAVPKATADSSNSPSAGITPGYQPQQAASTPTPQIQPTDSAELDKLQDELDQLSSRARAAKDSVENLRRQQNAQGLNLRGDMAAAEDRMGSDLDKAQAALQNQNAKDARRYMEKAEADLETLEKFMGRR